MEIHIKTTDFELTENLRSYIDEKLGSLERFSKKYGEAFEARLEIGRTTRHHREGNVFRAEVNIRVPGTMLRAESERTDIYAAIDEIRDEMERQLKEYRGKLFAKFKRGARVLKDFLRFGKPNA